MKTEKITYCVAEGETLNISASSLAALSLRGKTIIAKFQGTVMYISPGSTQTEILNRFAHAEYNAAAMQLTGNL